MKTVILNAYKMNYDSRLDFSQLDDEVVIYDDTTEEELLNRIQGFDIVVTKEMPISKETILAYPDCVKLHIEAGTGYNNLDLDAFKQKGITVCNIPAYSSKRVAATAIMLLLNLSSSMHAQMKMIDTKDMSNFDQGLMLTHVEVNDKTLGVIGYGNIAKEVIKVAIALGMHILVYTRTPKENTESITFCDFKTLLKESDYVSLHCPLTATTKHMMNKETLALMKPSAYLINTARGALIDELALIDALNQGKIAGAGLDVLEVEPPKHDHPLLTMNQVIITPHMGWKGLETRQRLVSTIKQDIDAFKASHPINVVS